MTRLGARSIVLAVGLVVLAFFAWTQVRSRKVDHEGAVLFRERCALCHATTDEGGRGPGLGGVVGRAAGTAPGFGYSRELRTSGLVWDAASLNRFLAAPATVVPGTTMPIPVPDDRERAAVVAFLATLKAAGPSSSAGDAARPPSPGDFRADAPGRRRHITLADLPAPYASPSSRNAPGVVDRPEGAKPRVPAGFSVALYARDLQNPRLIRAAPNGDVFVAETAADRIRVLRPADGAPAPASVTVFAEDLDKPFGIAFYPPGPDPRWVYVANTNSVVRFAYRPGDMVARAKPETIVPQLTEKGGGHSTRDVAFSPDQKRMFVSVGSASNVADGVPAKPLAEAQAWDASHGLGAAWGDETNRADVLVFDPDGKHERVFAAGIRNCVGLAVGAAGDLWCSTNERDGLGDDLVPDYVTRVREGAFYGWPWYYLGDHEDPRLAGQRPDLASRVTVPDVLLQAHSASLEMTFYDGTMFPAEYRGDAFAAFHGSWNRATRTGPKVVRIPMKDGAPTGEFEDFATGFVADDSHVWGRPVGVTVAHDGALLFSEDGNGTIWRVTYGSP